MERAFEERRMTAWVGKDLRISGNIVASADLTIDGQVEGTIELGDHSLTIGPGASVVANLVADVVTISGRVTGNVTGHTSVTLRAGCLVQGDVKAPVLTMEDGATLGGTVDVIGKPRH